MTVKNGHPIISAIITNHSDEEVHNVQLKIYGSNGNVFLSDVKDIEAYDSETFTVQLTVDWLYSTNEKVLQIFARSDEATIIEYGEIRYTDFREMSSEIICNEHSYILQSEREATCNDFGERVFVAVFVKIPKPN